jgi:hypothetical protein
MENYNDEQVSNNNIKRGFSLRLQIVISFIKRLINAFKVTQQDLSDAGVYISGRNLQTKTPVAQAKTHPNTPG